MMPPNMTPETPLVCIGITICVITQRVCSGVTPEVYFFLLGAAGFLAALAVSILRLIRRLSLAWRFLRRIFQVRRLSPRPIGRRLYLKLRSRGEVEVNSSSGVVPEA